MIVRDLISSLKGYDENSNVEVITKLKSNKNEYSIEYSPIGDVREVTVGCGVRVVGLVIPQ